MKRSLVLLLFTLMLSLYGCTTRPIQADGLPRSTPEAEGVSSQNILNFIDAVEKSKNEIHSIMILRHGKVIAEGWWNPYESDIKHTMYSTSKSFTSTAVGFAVAEKRLKLSDKVVSFFPKDVPENINPNLAALTVKDLLTMSVGQEPDPTFNVVTRDSNWIKSFLATPIKNKPGSKFLYNTLATYTLSAIVQKVTGEKIIDYLKPRLFEPLKIKDIDWETDPKGVNTGGWGLRIRTEDMAKFGQLYLQKGKWNDMQVLTPEWVDEATSFKIDQAPGLPQTTKDSSDWMQGYCYQFWRCRNNAFRADGAYGQYIIVMPEQDAVIAITSETPDMQNELNLVWEYLLPAFKKDKISSDKESDARLKDKLASLALPLFSKTKGSSLEEHLNEKTFVLENNDMNISDVGFKFKDNTCFTNIKYDSASYSIAFESGAWKLGNTKRPGPYLLAKAKGRYVGLPALKIAGNYQWADSNKLKLKLRYIESPHSENILCNFKSDSINLEFSNSFDFGSKRTKIKGAIKK